MFEKAMIMYLYVETPVHAGSGTAVNTTVDLPIQRERYTGYPIIYGSGLKGMLSKSAEKMGINNVEEVFGSGEMIGGVSITEAKILAFPLRTLAGVFGWITCPLVLQRLKRDLAMVGINSGYEIPQVETEKAIVSEKSNLKVEDKVYIEDLRLEIDTEKQQDENYGKIVNELKKGIPDDDVYNWIKEKFEKDLIIVHDELFANLVQICTEVMTRVRIGEDGTVEEGPWDEEYLPIDTLMYSLALIPRRQTIGNEIKRYSGKVVQIGGNATIGKGFVRIKIEEI